MLDIVARLVNSRVPRGLIHDADAEVIEGGETAKAVEPAGVPVWSHVGMLCTGETYRDKVKLAIAKDASLPDPSGLFNASLDGSARRAIDVREGGQIDETAFKALIPAAVRLNTAGR